ncbi:hypothetical protein LOTGIDRAFT_172062 [Lottia gigantea]|uniref:Uncharacterized protein n=1 Tax=Lottia gigantea TaxID=225164 RepID=V4AEH9_LOTGI|nr:hypothetical protein LOTGIDRAFT_172062 [Lottia gigantea]ESP02404.1 hypothetical protein LOTGIDRAFT_172062 [Lottia gigantea]
MGRPKKSKAALLANISKIGKSAGDKCTKIVDHNDQEYVAKSNSKASRFNDKVSKENVNELLVVHESDSPTEISYEKVEIPVKSKINNSYTPEAIYLHHRDENHYEVVGNVERSELIIVTDDNVDTQLSGKRKHLKKKRGSRWRSIKKRSIYFQNYHLVKKELNSGQKVRSNWKLAFRTKKEINSLNKRRRKQYQISYIKAHLKRKYANQLRSILHTQYETILKPKLGDKYQNVLKPKLEDKYQNVLKPKLEDKYQDVLKPKLEDKYQNVLKPKLEDKYQNVLKPKLEDKYQNVLKPKLEDKYQNVLKPKLEDKYQNVLKPKLEDKYQNVLKPRLKNKYQKVLKPKLKVKYQKILKWELKCKYIYEIKLKLKQRILETVQIYCCILKERRWVGETIYLCWVGVGNDGGLSTFEEIYITC